MSKVAQRLLTFFIGVPAVIALIWFNPSPQGQTLNFIQLHIFMLAVSVLSANEFYRMLKNKFELFPRWVILVFDAVVFCSEYIFMRLGHEPQLNIWVMAVLSVVLMASLVFKKNFSGIISKLALSIFIIFYCGFMLAFVPALTWFGGNALPLLPRFLIILFIVTIFMCDSCAWFFGVLFGKNNRGFFPASPNKSIVGFIGGIFGSVLFALLVAFLNNKFDLFKSGIQFPLYKIAIISFITAVFGIIGDLIESVFKRDMEVKDSGKLIPGRGGLLDCTDSITGAIPVYFILIYFFLNPEIQTFVSTLF